MSGRETSNGAGWGAAPSKLETIVELLRRPEGASLDVMAAATGWRPHSVRGAISGSLKKRKGLEVTSDKVEGVRTYRIVSGQSS